jgi:hypothetical protein
MPVRQHARTLTAPGEFDQETIARRLHEAPLMLGDLWVD